MSEPWEQRPGEGPKAWDAFLAYRDLGPTRSLAKVAAARAADGETASKTRQRTRQYEIWSGCWQWVERAKAWDAETDRVRREVAKEAVRKAAENHAGLAQLLQKRAFDRLKHLDPGELDMKALVEFVKAGVALERQARGMVDGPAEQDDTPGLIGVSDIEVARPANPPESRSEGEP